MTNKDNVRAKTLEELEYIHQELIKKLDILLDSGAINFDIEEDNYKLPHLIIQSLDSTMIKLFSYPFANAKDKKQIKDFKRLI